MRVWGFRVEEVGFFFFLLGGGGVRVEGFQVFRVKGFGGLGFRGWGSPVESS